MTWRILTLFPKGKKSISLDNIHFLSYLRSKIWLSLFITWLCPSIGLTFLDIFFDSILAVEYYTQWNNLTYVNKSMERYTYTYLRIPNSCYPYFILDAKIAKKPSWVQISTHQSQQYIALNIVFPLRQDLGTPFFSYYYP